MQAQVICQGGCCGSWQQALFKVASVGLVNMHAYGGSQPCSWLVKAISHYLGTFKTSLGVDPKG